MTVMEEPIPLFPAPKLKREVPMRHCFNCGAQLGRYRDYDRYDTYSAHECMQQACDGQAEDRREAHEALDERMGWGR